MVTVWSQDRLINTRGIKCQPLGHVFGVCLVVVVVVFLAIFWLLFGGVFFFFLGGGGWEGKEMRIFNIKGLKCQTF